MIKAGFGEDCMISGGEAAAFGAALCSPGFASFNHEASRTSLLNRFKALFKGEFVEASNARSAMSMVIGSASTGVRSFSVSGSNDLLSCTDLLHNASGLRLPVVLSVLNGSTGAPFNGLNDHSDSMSVRDSGWIQLHCSSVQEVLDTVIQAFKLGEGVGLPVMVCLDSVALSHLFEKVRIPSFDGVKKFLSDYIPKYSLNTKSPVTVGVVSSKNFLTGFKRQQEDAMFSSLEAVKKVNSEFQAVFGRSYGNGLVEEFNTQGAETIIVCAGSVCGTVKSVVEKHKGVGLLRIKSLRPFPVSDVVRVLSSAQRVGVIDRCPPLGGSGALLSDVKAVSPVREVNGFVMGLGGSPITVKDVEFVLRHAGLTKNFWGESK